MLELMKITDAMRILEVHFSGDTILIELNERNNTMQFEINREAVESLAFVLRQWSESADRLTGTANV